jgi:hypothetical protein
VAKRSDGVHLAPGDAAMTMMDFWYDRAIYEMADLNEEATELRREAETALPFLPAKQADEEDE